MEGAEDITKVLNEVALSGQNPPNPTTRSSGARKRALEEPALVPERASKRQTRDKTVPAVQQINKSRKNKAIGTLSRPSKGALSKSRTDQPPIQKGEDVYNIEDDPEPRPQTVKGKKGSKPVGDPANLRTRRPGRLPKNANSKDAAESSSTQGAKRKQQASKKPRQTRHNVERPETSDEGIEASGRGNDAQSEDNDEASFQDEAEDNQVDDEEGGENQTLEDGVDGALLGQDQDWKEALKAAAENHPEDHFISMDESDSEERDSDVIRGMRAIIQEALSLYHSLLDYKKKKEAAPAELEQTLGRLLENLKASIGSIRRFNANMQDTEEKQIVARQIVEGIYEWAIPGLVYLLKSAMSYRYDRSKELYELSGLEEVVNIMKTTVELCWAGHHWSLKPHGGLSVVKNIKKTAFPILRSLMKHFEGIKIDLSIEVKRQRNREECVLKKPIKRLPPKLDRYAQAKVIKENILQLSQNNVSSQASIYHRQPSLKARREESHYKQRNSWTDSQVLALFYELNDPKSRDLPAKERYLKILNAPELQNKLPEHIRDQALELRELIINTGEGNKFNVEGIVYVDFGR